MYITLISSSIKKKEYHDQMVTDQRPVAKFELGDGMVRGGERSIVERHLKKMNTYAGCSMLILLFSFIIIWNENVLSS